MITLTRQSYTEGEYHQGQAFFMNVTATSIVADLSQKIFVLHYRSNPGMVSRLSCLASLTQMSELPEDVPDLTGDPIIPFFRVDSMELVAFTLDELEDLWAKLIEDAQDLVNAYKASLTLSETNSITVT